MASNKLNNLKHKLAKIDNKINAHKKTFPIRREIEQRRECKILYVNSSSKKELIDALQQPNLAEWSFIGGANSVILRCIVDLPMDANMDDVNTEYMDNVLAYHNTLSELILQKQEIVENIQSSAT